jgi:hypothetical protein
MREPLGVSGSQAISTTFDMLRQLSIRACLIFMLSTCGAASLLYHGLAKPITITEEILFKAADLSDPNWQLGVSTSGNTILVPFETSLLDALKVKKYLVLEDGSRVEIESVVDAGEGWIHVHTDTINPALMSYPHRLIGVQ